MLAANSLRHLAIIMDGNGRWAAQRGHPRFWGHVKGARVARDVIEECSRRGLDYLTLYAFSTENWLRPKAEVDFLMRLLARHLKREQKTLLANNIRFRAIGELDRLPDFAKTAVTGVVEATQKCDGMKLVFAISYGGQQELVAAAKNLVTRSLERGLLPQDIDESTFRGALESGFLPDIDLLIRTSGEYRISNFLPWQASYAELCFTQTHWPDFTLEELQACLNDFSGRQRRFGAVTADKNHVLAL